MISDNFKLLCLVCLFYLVTKVYIYFRFFLPMAYISYYLPDEEFLHSGVGLELHVGVGEHVLPGSVICTVLLTSCNYRTKLRYRVEHAGIVRTLCSPISPADIYPGQLLCQLYRPGSTPSNQDYDAYQLEMDREEYGRSSCVFSGSQTCLCRNLIYPYDSD